MWHRCQWSNEISFVCVSVSFRFCILSQYFQSTSCIAYLLHVALVFFFVIANGIQAAFMCLCTYFRIWNQFSTITHRWIQFTSRQFFFLAFKVVQCLMDVKKMQLFRIISFSTFLFPSFVFLFIKLNYELMHKFMMENCSKATRKNHYSSINKT